VRRSYRLTAAESSVDVNGGQKWTAGSRAGSDEIAGPRRVFA